MRSVVIVLIAATVSTRLAANGAEAENINVLYTSPSGAFRIEDSTLGEEEADKRGIAWVADAWLVSKKDPAQRAKLPIKSPMSVPDEFHSSSNDEWIFGLWHGGSGLRDGDLFHRVSPLQVDTVGKDKSFNELVWENCVKLGALKENYSAEGVDAMTSFVCWSIDSSRLLVKLAGGENKRTLHEGYLYFNTRTKMFEMTNYLRKLNKTKSAPLACAEPTDPLPGESELKARLQTLDEQLNKAYGERIAKTQKDRVSILRASQRDWIKHRDEGLKFYLEFAPSAEKERRRLQFLVDVTFARVDDFDRPVDEDI